MEDKENHKSNRQENLKNYLSKECISIQSATLMLLKATADFKILQKL